jgi:hypothetical protein
VSSPLNDAPRVSCLWAPAHVSFSLTVSGPGDEQLRLGRHARLCSAKPMASKISLLPISFTHLPTGSVPAAIVRPTCSHNSRARRGERPG